MELFRVVDYCVKLKNFYNIEKSSRFSNPILPIGFLCNKKVQFCVVHKGFLNDGKNYGETKFSEMSFSDRKQNVCYLFYKNRYLKKHMFQNVVDMFDTGVVYIRILIPSDKCSGEYMKYLSFHPIFGRFTRKKTFIKGKRMGFISKKSRFMFHEFVDMDELYLDSQVWDKVSNDDDKDFAFQNVEEIGEKGVLNGIKPYTDDKQLDKLGRFDDRDFQSKDMEEDLGDNVEKDWDDEDNVDYRYDKKNLKIDVNCVNLDEAW